MIIEAKDILRLEYSLSDNFSNYYYYKKDMDNWFLCKYENLQSPSVPEDAGDNFIVKTDYIIKFKRAILRMS